MLERYVCCCDCRCINTRDSLMTKYYVLLLIIGEARAAAVGRLLQHGVYIGNCPGYIMYYKVHNLARISSCIDHIGSNVLRVPL